MHASVVGQRCTIGPGAVLRDAYVFDDTHVGAGCVVEGSIVGARVRLGDGCHVPRGCLVADGVVIGPGAHLRNFERVSKKRDAPARAADDGSDGDDEEDDDSDLEEVEASTYSIVADYGACVAELEHMASLQTRKVLLPSWVQIQTR